jgi:hypothetical protein
MEIMGTTATSRGGRDLQRGERERGGREGGGKGGKEGGREKERGRVGKYIVYSI